MNNEIFFSKSKYLNPTRNNRTQTKNTCPNPIRSIEIPERVLYPYTEIPKNPKYLIRTRTSTPTAMRSYQQQPPSSSIV